MVPRGHRLVRHLLMQGACTCMHARAALRDECRTTLHSLRCHLYGLVGLGDAPGDALPEGALVPSMPGGA